jgi:hypothetical protein
MLHKGRAFLQAFACMLIMPFALVMGSVRCIPFGWQLIECLFGVFGFIPPWVCGRQTKALSRLHETESVGVATISAALMSKGLIRRKGSLLRPSSLFFHPVWRAEGGARQTGWKKREGIVLGRRTWGGGLPPSL